MPSKQNIEKVKQAKKWFKDADSLLIVHYTGLKVLESSELRSLLGEKGAPLRVIKNTLAKIALTGSGKEELVEFIDGPTAAVFVEDDLVPVSKIITDYAKGRKGLWIQGGMLSGRVLSRKEAETLATLPSRDVLLGQVAGQVKSPLNAMAGVCSGLFRNALGGLSAVLRQKEAAEG